MDISPTVTAVSTDEIIFTNMDLKYLIQKLKCESGKGIWICGGASIVNQALDVTDRFCITIIPTILGAGIPLFTKHKNRVAAKTCFYNAVQRYG